MQELKDKIKLCSDERKEYKAKLEEVYEMVAGDNAINRYDQAEIVDRIKEYYDCYQLLTYATSDEYVDLYNRMDQEEGLWLIKKS